jgi:hypothetical protein
LDSRKHDRVKKKVRWLFQNGYTFSKKTIKGRDYLYARKGEVYKSAGPYAIAEPYLRSLISRKEQEPVVPRGADETASAATRREGEIAAAARREFDQLKADAIVDPSRLKDYINRFVSLKDTDLWNRFSLLAGSEGLNVQDAESVNRSYRGSVRKAVARGEQPPSYHDHVVEKLKEWVAKAIESKRGWSTPLGTMSLSCRVCHGAVEAYPNPNTDFKTYRVRCNSCSKYRMWRCCICDETMLCIKDDKQTLYLRCPKCEYGCGLARPIKLNSPQTEAGWELLERITVWDPGKFEVFPDRILKLVNHYESRQELYSKTPTMLTIPLRKFGFAKMEADAIASTQLSKPVWTSDETVWP